MTPDTANPIEPPEVHIYTDGACSGNPGKGGFGVVILNQGQRQELSGGFRYTTNNRMEILGAIVGLKTLTHQNSKVTLYSDSKYLVDMFNGGHAKNWRDKGWIRNQRKEPAKNPDLWNDLLNISTKHEVQMVWVKGHASNPHNARCDELAVEARLKDDLPSDEGYVNPVSVVPPAPVVTKEEEQDLFGWVK
jgi:ribonuclease HI